MENNVTQVHHTSKEELIELILNGIDEKFSNLKKQLTPSPPSTLVSRKDIAIKYGVSTTTIDNWSRLGILKRYRIGNQIRFRLDEAEQALTKINK